MNRLPFEAINEEVYNELCSEMPLSLDWHKLVEYENDDSTKVSQEFACTGAAIGEGCVL